MARCNCNPTGTPCLSSDPGNSLSFDSNGCLFGAPQPTPVTGQANLASNLDLVPTANNAWTDIPGLSAVLTAGTWEVVADVSGTIHVEYAVSSPPAPGTNNTRIFQRLFNATTATAIADTQKPVAGTGTNLNGRFTTQGEGTSHTFITVASTTTIQVQAQKVITTVSGTTITVLGTTAVLGGNTTLRWQKIS